jgi:hypothetical protein
VTDFGISIGEAKWLPNVDILLDRGIEESSINVQMAKLEVHGGGNGKDNRRLAILMTSENVFV